MPTRKLRAIVAGLIWSLTLVWGIASYGGATANEQAIANGAVHMGTEVTADVPKKLRVRNTRGTDKQGLCVWASAQIMANYLNISELFDLFDWMKTQPGGGWPQRVEEVMKARAPNRIYAQHIGADLAFIRKGIESGRPVCVTYGYGEIYDGTISHMVICVHMDDKITAIIDNNEPEVVRWMSTKEFAKRFTHTDGYGWAWYILASPPPPVPHN
jgi:hypothetical protein